ncbi:uncharacterized protein [Rutidosis leptorrhynchoides]|uniref:uncharacterized protein n=1 Tax=Rutidosis leptorrhynchoides TaxID=125765 RepID=UPI003A98CE9A
MPGDKRLANSPGLKSDACAYLTAQNVISGGAGIPSDMNLPYSANVASSVNSGAGKHSVRYPSTTCYDHHFPGLNGTYHQSDGSCHSSYGGPSYMDEASLYYMSGCNPYGSQTFLGVDGQNPHLSSSAYTNDAIYQNPTYWGVRSGTGSNGSSNPNGVNSRKSMMTISNEGYPNYQFDMQSQESTFNISRLGLQSPHISSLNKLGAASRSGGASSCYQPCSNLSSLAYKNQGLFANYSVIQSPKLKESDELTCGPRAQTSIFNNGESESSTKSDRYNLDGFQTKYEQAKFYIIKSYSEDDVHKCVKYDVWSSTPNGNKKLDDAYREAEEKVKETGSKCPVFLFFSVNGSGQFVGVAEMTGSVVYEKDMDFWQLDKWSGFFPVKWHIIKDIPNSQLRHIILENNDNRPVTYTRDTQEVGLQQGLEMLDIFKSHPSKASLLDDLSFYEDREKSLKARRISKLAFQTEKNSKLGEGCMSTKGSLDPASSLINLTRNLTLNTDMPKDKPST